MRNTVLWAAALVAGCGSSSPDPHTARAADVELATRAVDRALGAATLFVSMGVIAPGMGPDVNAGALHQRVLSETNNCAAAAISGTTLDIDLSAGCTLASTNVVYKGSIHAEVSQPATGTIQIQATLDLVVDGAQPLGGTVFLTTSDGNTFTYQAGLTMGAVTVSAPNLRAGIAAFGAQFDIMQGTLTGASGMYTIDAMGLHQRFGGCYADDGYLHLSAAMMGMTPALEEYWLFSSPVPQTGQVAVGTSPTDSAPKVFSLPKRMGCPTASM